MNTLMGRPMDALGLTPKPTPSASEPKPEPLPGDEFSDVELLDIWRRVQRESFDNRAVFMRQWTRNIYYILNRQWIEYHGKTGGWKDKRMAPWIPRPVTNKCKETVTAIRAMFTAVKLGVTVRPNGASPKNVATAATADELAPQLHKVHIMDTNLNEADFWLCTTGNAFFHEYIDYNPKNGFLSIPTEQCVGCGYEATSDQLTGTQAVCPECGGTEFQPAIDEMSGEPKVALRPVGRPTTCALSPLELTFPNDYPRFEDLPYVVRLRWRTKSYYEAHPSLKPLVSKISWQKAPQDEALLLFRALATQNDIGVTPSYDQSGNGAMSNEDGIPEYEVWMKPTERYPKGLVFRVIGDKGDLIARVVEENLPGPLPYTDVEGVPLFPFQHEGFEHVGGRIWASSPLDAIIQKQDQLNQLDSMVLLIIQRMANPVWLEPKGAEIERLTGMPGLVVKWNPLTVGGNAKPERIDGVGPPNALFQIREQILKDIEELSGTYDVVKGAKPTGVEAFSALQLLVERSQTRFASVFLSRGNAYQGWCQIALELEREFGPNERIVQSLTPARTWTFKEFKRAQLQGSVSVIVEDGSTSPKTNLGMRAALQQAQALGMLDTTDPDVSYEGLKIFGLTRIAPSIDVHVQAALRKQQQFEEWIMDPMAIQQSMMMAQQKFQQYTVESAQADPMMGIVPPPSPLADTPLKWLPWYGARIHRQEFLKWANSDQMRELLEQKPEAQQLMEMHLSEIEMALQKEQMLLAGPPPPAQGAGMAMANSNQESTSGIEPSGTGEGAQGQGPA